MIYAKEYKITPTPKTEWCIKFWVKTLYTGEIGVIWNAYRNKKYVEKHTISPKVLPQIKRIEGEFKKEFLQWCCKTLDIQD